ncbi:hypothetical protein ACFORL_01250 [Legionella dresdenensis]|uniref:Coiled-coil protein n=1 Tax=Legionella dresdenensis TaxID=450200 RepID=A0ABV8CBV1_9GAMM
MLLRQDSSLLIKQLCLRTQTLKSGDIRYQLAARLRLLNQKLSAPEQSRLVLSAQPLLNKLCVLSVDIFRNYHHAKTHRRGEKLVQCITLVNEILTSPENDKAIAQLHELAFIGDYEKQRYTSGWKHYLAVGTDKVINSVNAARTFVFGSTFQRSRLATYNFISDNEVHHFLLSAQQSTCGKTLKALLPEPSVSEAGQTVYLCQDILIAYENFKKMKHRQSTLNQCESLLNALNEFALQVNRARNNEVLNTAAQNAFLASQDLVLEILQSKKAQPERMKKLITCFKQTAKVLEQPGNLPEVYKLEELVEKSDYKRRKRNTENTSYALIHILVSTILFGVAIADAVATHGANLITHIFTLGAEILSLAVGGGQLYHFSDSHIEKTLYFESMTDLFKAVKLKTCANDWAEIDESPIKQREKILNQLVAQNTDLQIPVVNELSLSLATLRNQVVKPDNDLMRQQGLAVLITGEDLAIDLLRQEKISIDRINKLKESIDAACDVIKDPSDMAAVNKLAVLANQRGFEQRRINKAGLFAGSLLLLAGLAIFAVTIAGTILSAGATAGTIISAIMITALAINKIIESCKKQETGFGQQARALSEFGIMSDVRLPVIHETPLAEAALPVCSS